MTTPSLRIAVLGIGMMGSPMARRLQQAGHTVHAWNRTQSKSRSAGSVGHCCACHRRRGGATADIVVSLLENGPAVEHVLFHAGAAQTMRPGVCSSTWRRSSPARRATTPHGLVKWAWRTWMLRVWRHGGPNGTLAIMAGAGQKTSLAHNRCSPHWVAPPMWGRTAAGSSPNWPTR